MKARLTNLAMGLAATVSIAACGPKGSPPSIPLSLAPSGAVETGSETHNGDAIPAEIDNSSPWDATVAHRLNALPAGVREKVLACEAQGNFYDLGDQTCTELKPTDFACVINDEFKSTRIDPSTVTGLDNHLTTTEADHRLYSCTEDTVNVTLHFYKFDNNVISYKKLNVPRKPNGA